MSPKIGRIHKKRPSYPSVRRQWLGLALIAIAIVGMEVASNMDAPPRSQGNILLLMVMFVTYLSGLRAGIIASVASVLYLLYAYALPGQPFFYSERNHARIISAAIVIPAFALIVGSVQNRLRNAAIREYDARQSAEAESLQREQTEGALRSSEELRRLVVDSAMDGIVAIDDKGVVTLWNDAAEQMFGWTRSEATGRLLADLIIPPIYREVHLRGLQRFMETGQSQVLGKRLDLTALTKEGVEFPVELSIVQHSTDDGPIFVGFIRDVTEQRMLNDRLRQAQKMEAIGTLAGGIAHDFNNILSAISGNVLLARSDLQDNHPAQLSLAEIEKAVGRATYVVRQILTFSRSRETKPIAVDLSEVLREAVDFLRATLPATIEVETAFDADLPPVIADSTDIHQIILNLGINASHAMERRGTLTVAATSERIGESEAESLLGIEPGQYVRVSVKDTGCGIDAKTQQRIFEPFFTTKAQGEGTGLGLSVVYGIVERHRGAITVQSEPGKGAVFNIYLPASSNIVLHEEQSAASPELGNGEHILYVDDDESLVYMTTRVLTRLNYKVTGFDDPRQGLDAFRNDPHGFDLVITDMSMPHIDGPTLVKQIQEIRKDVPIVMVTGYIRPKDLEQTRDLGICELILKPNSVHELAQTLHDILQTMRPDGALKAK